MMLLNVFLIIATGVFGILSYEFAKQIDGLNDDVDELAEEIETLKERNNAMREVIECFSRDIDLDHNRIVTLESAELKRRIKEINAYKSNRVRGKHVRRKS